MSVPCLPLSPSISYLRSESLNLVSARVAAQAKSYGKHKHGDIKSAQYETPLDEGIVTTIAHIQSLGSLGDRI